MMVSSARGFLLLLILSGGASSQTLRQPDYFDRLRVEPDLLKSVVTSNSASNIVRVETVEGETYRLGHIAAFVPFSTGKSYRSSTHNDGAAALLALHEFNNMETSSFFKGLGLENCDLRLTASLHDTRFNPVDTTRLVTAIVDKENSLEDPLPVSAAGSFRSAVTSPMAILNSVREIPQVSYGATSTDFDFKEQYPIFGRTCPSTVGEARVSVDYLVTLGYTHVGIMFVSDAFGSAFQKAFQEYAMDVGMITKSAAFTFSTTSDNEIRLAVAALKRSEFRVFYVICFEDHYPLIMNAAIDEGLVGPDFFWMFSTGISKLVLQKELAYPIGSKLYNATRGIALLQMEPSAVDAVIYPGVEQVVPLRDPPVTSNELFRTIWRRAIMDPVMVKYFQEKLPTTLDAIPGFNRSEPFTLEPSLSALMFDAIVAMAISMCRANSEFFTGKEMYSKFIDVTFDGGTGKVVFEKATGTRDYKTLTFSVLNILPDDQVYSDGLGRFKLVPTSHSTNGEWMTVPNQEFIYSDGTTAPPNDLPPLEEDKNMIGQVGKTVGYALMGLVLLVGLCTIIWTIVFKHERVVTSSQSSFLFMISIGSIVMALTVFPISLEDTIDENYLDVACMATPWLYTVGFLLAFSALFTKTRQIREIYKFPELDVITITRKEMIVTFLVFMGLNGVVLVAWTLDSPLKWNRVYTGSTDIFDRQVESYGGCSTSSGSAFPFVMLLLVINFGLLLLSNYWSYQARHLETEYEESRYIGISLASLLQAGGMGIPIFIVVDKNPQAKFFVQTGIILVTSLALLLIIFIPKIRAVKLDEVLAGEESRRELYSRFRSRARFDNDIHNPEDEQEVFVNDPSSTLFGGEVEGDTLQKAPVETVEIRQESNSFDNNSNKGDENDSVQAAISKKPPLQTQPSMGLESPESPKKDKNDGRTLSSKGRSASLPSMESLGFDVSSADPADSPGDMPTDKQLDRQQSNRRVLSTARSMPRLGVSAPQRDDAKPPVGGIRVLSKPQPHRINDLDFSLANFQRLPLGAEAGTDEDDS